MGESADFRAVDRVGVGGLRFRVCGLRRFCGFLGGEAARFGEDRLELILDEEEGVQDMLVPPFLIQPLVENAVRHAMPSEGKLTIVLSAWVEGTYLKIRVADNGVGMSQETCDNIMHPESSTGMGIAVKNVHDRIIGYFGSQSGMDVQSKLGEGTQVTLSLSLSEIERYV